MLRIAVSGVIREELQLMSAKAVAAEKACSAPHCEGHHYAKDYCKKHYTQITKHGKLTPERERGAPRTCKVDGCERTDTIRWHCRKHARQLAVYGRLTPEKEHVMGRTGCSMKGCPEPHRANGFCARHYNQERWKRMSASPKKTKKKTKAKVKK
jgi:hypothetical protein